MPLRQKALVALATLMLVCTMVVLGGMLGMQLGKQAIARSNPAPEEVDVDTTEREQAAARVALLHTTTTTTERPESEYTTVTPSAGREPAHREEEEEEETTLTTTTVATTVTTTTATTTTVTTLTTTTAYFPTLFCFSVMRSDPDSYELGLVRTQLAKGVSIFKCESWRVYSDVKTWLTPGPPVRLDSTVINIGLEAKSGVKEHILNTEIFLKAWEQAFDEGLIQKTEWSVKVDPDAVFFPERLQHRLMKYVKAPGASIYFLNCKLSFELYGALEVFSKVAMERFFDGLHRCKTELPWKTYGEDLFFRRCMDLLDITHIRDYGMLSDEYCAVKPFPCVADSAAFHPFKASETYFKCVEEAKEADKTRMLE